MSTGQNNKLRLPAEWEPVDAVLMAWPHGNTDWAYMLDEVRQIGRASCRERVCLYV